MKTTLEFPVRFGDVDHARVVYYPRFFHYFHQALENWFGEVLGVPYPELVTTHNMGFPSVRVETEFRSPLRYGDTVRIEVEPVAVGHRSITMRYRALRMPEGVLSAEATIKTCVVDNDTFRAVEIPQVWRQRVKQLIDKRQEAR